MATYLEMKILFNDTDLKNRCETAVVKAATVMLNTDVTVEGRELVKKVYNDRIRYSGLALNAVIMANEGKSVDEIKALTDADIQAVVDASAPLLKGM